MIKKIKKFIKEYGVVKTALYSLKKIKSICKLKKIRKSIDKNKEIYNLSFLNNYQTESNFFYNINSREKIKEFYNQNNNLKELVLNDAEKILEHKFNFLSSKEFNLGKDIKWNEDFKSNFIWENKFYKDIKVVDLNNNADVKIPWELSRFQHIFTLGKAYWITDDKKYYEEFKIEILDWVKKNPMYLTVNWTCAMDVAIRSVNMIFGYFLFEDLIKNDKEFLNILNKALYKHGIFIFDNLEKGLSPANNHYLSDLNGLIFLGIYFKSLNKETKKWLDFGIKELEKEMFIENNEDGTNYEASTSYHRLVTELMFYPSLLLEKNNLSFSSSYKERLKKLFEFMAKITKPNGKYPLIGDVDNGRLIILSEYYDWQIDDCRSLISLGGEYFDSTLLKKIGASNIEDKQWIFESTSKYSQNYFSDSVSFDNGGYYILRNKNIYCMIRCGELSMRGQGGHSHNDQLSIELNVCGEDFFVDTGTGVYTANKDIRNLFRSTKMHNTIMVENLEQNSFSENNLFEMKEESFTKCVEFSKTKFVGEHYGYLNRINIIHKREVNLGNDYLEIIDQIGDKEGIFNLHLDLGVSIVEKDNNIILRKNNVELILETKDINYSIKDSVISKKYGEIEDSKKIELKFKNRDSLIIKVRK